MIHGHASALDKWLCWLADGVVRIDLSTWCLCTLVICSQTILNCVYAALPTNCLATGKSRAYSISWYVVSLFLLDHTTATTTSRLQAHATLGLQAHAAGILGAIDCWWWCWWGCKIGHVSGIVIPSLPSSKSSSSSSGHNRRTIQRLVIRMTTTTQLLHGLASLDNGT